jgi:gliding motility-associated-like protein
VITPTHRFLLFLFLLVTAVQKPGAAQNLVTNGTFASGGAGWTFFAPATGTEAYNPETSYGGSAAGNIVGEIDNGANLRQANIPVVPGETYFISFRRSRRTLGGAPNPTGVKVKVYNGAAVFLDQDVFSNNTTWGWQCEQFQFTPTTNTVSLDFENITATISTLGTMLDDITIASAEQPITLTGSLCQGGSFTLSAPASDPNSQYTGYSWTGPNGFSSTSQDIIFSNAQPGLSGVYTCTMTLNGCLEVSGSYNVVINPNIINITQDICKGESFRFFGKDLFEQGEYDTLIISANNSCDSLVVLQLNVNPLPDISVRPSSDVDICAGDSIALVLNTADASVTYQWFADGVPVGGETGNQYFARNTGLYYVVATTGKQCTDTSVKIRVNTHDLPVAEIRFEDWHNICTSDTVSLTAAPGAASYAWGPGNVFRGVSDPEQQSVRAKLLKEETTVVLRVYNEIGCPAEDSVQLYAKACCELFVPDAFSPNGDAVNDFFNAYIDRGQLIVSFVVFDRYGKMIYNNNSLKGWDGRYPNGEPAAPGVYMYHLQYTCGSQEIRQKKGDITLIK